MKHTVTASRTPGRKAGIIPLAAAFVLVPAAIALANTSNGTDFQNIYQKVAGWMTGLPIIMVVIAIAFTGIIRAVRSGEIVMGLGYCVFGAVIYLLPSLIVSLGGCTF